MTLAALQLPHFLILGWMALGVVALWVAHRLGVSGNRQINILLPMALGLVVFTLYLSTRNNYDFIHDDVDIVERHPDVKAADGWKTLWSHDYRANQSVDTNLYRPITILSYWANARLPLGAKLADGVAVEIFPRYFRGVNMVVLALLGWLIAIWLNTYVQPTAAWLAAFLFVAHPSHSLLVNYIVGRADLLAMFGVVGFLLIQRLAFLGKGIRWWHWIFAVLFAAVAFGAKESGLILIPAAAIQAWVGRRNADSEVTDYVKPIEKRIQFATVIWIVLPLTLYMFGRVNAVGTAVNYANTATFVDDVSSNPMVRMEAVRRAPASISNAWFYTSQIVLPDTSFSQIPHVIPGWRSTKTILGLTVLLAGVILFFGVVRRRHWIALGLMIAFSQYLLVCNLILPISVYAANRLMLPFSFLGAVVAAHLVHCFCLQSTRRRALAIIPAIVVVLFMSPVIQDVSFNWGSEARLVGWDRRRDPSNPVVQYNFAASRSRQGRSAQLRTQAISYAIGLIERVQGVTETDPISTRVQLENDLNRLRSMMQPVEGIAVVPRHPDQFQTLKLTPRQIDQALGRMPNLLEQKAELDDLKLRLHDELKNSKTNADRYLAESVGVLEYVLRQRPGSVNARVQMATTLGYLKQAHRARSVYLSIALMKGRDSNIHVLDAKVKYGALCIELNKNRVLATQLLTDAEATLEILLAKQGRRVPKIDKQLQQLNTDAKRYLKMLESMDSQTVAAP